MILRKHAVFFLFLSLSSLRSSLAMETGSFQKQRMVLSLPLEVCKNGLKSHDPYLVLFFTMIHPKRPVFKINLRVLARL